MSAIDFGELKKHVTLLQAAEMLSLTLKEHNGQYRGPCPTCKRGGERALVITPEKGWSCFAAKVNGRYPGGDVIAIVAHVRGTGFKEAAQELATRFPVNGARQVGEIAKAVTDKLPVPDSLAKVRTYIQYEHPDVQALGINPETAEKLGIGYKGKGVLSGYVVMPLYVDGKLVSYMGYNPRREQQLMFPPKIGERI